MYLSIRGNSANFLSAIVMLLTTSIANADIRSATGKPFVDFYTVRGAISSVRAIKDVCNERYPEMQSRNDKAYALWQEKYRLFRYKIERYNEKINQNLTERDDPDRRFRKDALLYEGLKQQQREFLMSLGDHGYQACKNFPAYTQSEKADFETYMAEHVAVFENHWLKQPR